MAASRPRRFSARQALEFILEEGSDIDDSDDNELNEYSSDEYELQDDEMREQDSTSDHFCNNNNTFCVSKSFS